VTAGLDNHPAIHDETDEQDALCFFGNSLGVFEWH